MKIMSFIKKKYLRKFKGGGEGAENISKQFQF